MSSKPVFFIFLIQAISLTAFAQNGSGLVVDAFRRAEQDLVLLKNEHALIPLMRLDTLSIALVELGMPEDGDFSDILGKYAPVQRLKPPRSGDTTLSDEWIAHIQDHFNLVIIGIHDSGSGEAAFETLEPALRKLLSVRQCIIAVFGGDRAFRKCGWLDQAGALVFTPYNEYAPSLAAQLIFGGLGASGRLATSLNAGFGTGAGLFTQGGLRLRYSPPEVVGVDREKLQDSIRAIVEEGIIRGAYPGAQVVVAKDGHVIYQEAFGFHTYDSVRQVTLEDLYDYASVTKISAALPALMKLYGEGRFDLDAPLSRYFPYFDRSNKDQLTFRSMLAHNARLRAWIPYWKGTLRGNARYPWRRGWDEARLNDYRFRSRTFRRDSSAAYPVRVTADLWLHRRFKEHWIYRSIRKSPLNEEPGYVYSGLLFYLLPEIIGDLTGEDFETYIKSQFYERIGAYTITFNPGEHFPKDRIVPTEKDSFFRMEQIQGAVHDEGAAMMGGVSGNAGLFSTANDLAKLMQLYLNYGNYGGEQLIPENAVREFAKYQYAAEGNRRGLGFDKPLLEYKAEDSYVARSAGPESFGHSGYTGTFTWVDPEQGLLLVFFSNRVYTTRDNRKLYTLNIRPRLHQACYDAITATQEK